MQSGSPLHNEFAPGFSDAGNELITLQGITSPSISPASSVQESGESASVEMSKSIESPDLIDAVLKRLFFAGFFRGTSRPVNEVMEFPFDDMRTILGVLTECDADKQIIHVRFFESDANKYLSSFMVRCLKLGWEYTYDADQHVLSMSFPLSSKPLSLVELFAKPIPVLTPEIVKAIILTRNNAEDRYKLLKSKAYVKEAIPAIMQETLENLRRRNHPVLHQHRNNQINNLIELCAGFQADHPDVRFSAEISAMIALRERSLRSSSRSSLCLPKRA